jgi:hypothetical protein
VSSGGIPRSLKIAIFLEKLGAGHNSHGLEGDLLHFLGPIFWAHFLGLAHSPSDFCPQNQTNHQQNREFSSGSQSLVQHLIGIGVD